MELTFPWTTEILDHRNWKLTGKPRLVLGRQEKGNSKKDRTGWRAEETLRGRIGTRKNRNEGQ